MAQNFSDKEDALYEDWYNSYSAEEQKNFCFDGLMFGRNDDRNAEAEKWLKAKRRVLFLMKDTNDNPGDDIRWCLWAMKKIPTAQSNQHTVFILFCSNGCGLSTK